MVTYSRHNTTFVLRAAAVIEHRGRILLRHDAKNLFWSLPGGKIAFREEAEQAVRREIFEALQIEVQVARLLWVVENLYIKGGKKQHELGMYFLAHLARDTPLGTLTGPFEYLAEREADGKPDRQIYQWFAKEELPGITIHPAFLSTALMCPENQIVHIQNLR